MTRKLLSLVTAIGMLYVYLQSQLHSDDALFLVTSDNIAVNLSLIALASAAVYISFAGKFQSWQSYLVTAIGALSLGFIGAAGFTYVGLANNFSSVIKPFDYIIILQLGITFGLSALSYRHPAVNFKLPQLPTLEFKHHLSALVPRPDVSAKSRPHIPRPA